MKLAPVFTDNAVFAENKPVYVFGSGEGNICAAFRGDTVSAECKDGKWLVRFPAREAGGPFALTVTDGTETVTLNDVYVGLVYLVAGQSNAEFRLEESNTQESEYVSDAMMRSFFVARPWDENDPVKMSDGWQKAVAGNVGKWSALGYLVARAVRKEKGGCVGFVSCFQGASCIESWLAPEDSTRFRLPDEELYCDHFIPEFAYWNRNSVIYDSMLCTLFPFSFSGVVWYQGESDASPAEAAIYASELESLFDTMRRSFRDKTLRVALVQIADCDERIAVNSSGWRGIQRAQELYCERDGNARLVVSRDICETDCIHPPTKTALAQRIADALLCR